MMTYAPILLFVYNRLWHTQQTISSLRQNKEAAESDLIIFSDGPKQSSDIESVSTVRAVLKNVTGFKSITIIERPSNLGLANSIINGVTETLKSFDRVIVLEDDLITSPYFLSYMNQGLTCYKEESNVISIHGYAYPAKKLPEYFFLRGADCWGWATWKRGWQLFNPDGKFLLQELKRQQLIDEFDFNKSFRFSKMLEDQIAKKNDSWAIRWYASAFLANKLTLHPGTSYIKNIGFDNSGTHSSSLDQTYDGALREYPVELKKIDITEDTNARQSISFFLKKTQHSLLNRVIHKFKRLVNWS